MSAVNRRRCRVKRDKGHFFGGKMIRAVDVEAAGSGCADANGRAAAVADNLYYQYILSPQLLYSQLYTIFR